MDKKELLHQMKEILDGERLPPGLDDGYTFTDWTALYSSQEEKHYDFKAPKGFTERWGIGRGRTKELTQCPHCEVYTDDPEHWCGSTALACRGRYTYQGWRYFWKKMFWVWGYKTPLPLRRFP